MAGPWSIPPAGIGCGVPDRTRMGRHDHEGVWATARVGRASVPVLIHPEFWNRLVALTGCGHAGVVNIARYARRLTGIEQVYTKRGRR